MAKGVNGKALSGKEAFIEKLQQTNDLLKSVSDQCCKFDIDAKKKSKSSKKRTLKISMVLLLVFLFAYTGFLGWLPTYIGDENGIFKYATNTKFAFKYFGDKYDKYFDEEA